MKKTTPLEAVQLPGKKTGRSLSHIADPYLLPISLVCVILLWDAAGRFFGIPTYIVPTPLQVGKALYRIFAGGLFWNNFYVTLLETFGGFALAFAVSMFIAILMTQSRVAEKILYPYVAGLQTMPKIAIAPLIILWFGFGLESKVVLAALLGFFPMLVNFSSGLRATDANRLRLLRVLDASPWQVIWLVRLPSSLPFLLAGMELGAIYAMLGAIVGEFIGSRAGVGYWLLQMNTTMDFAGSFALLAVLAGYGILIQGLLRFARRKLLFWTASEQINVNR